MAAEKVEKGADVISLRTDIEVMETNLGVTYNLLMHLYGEICENAPTTDQDTTSVEYKTKKYIWSGQADYIQAITKGALSMLDEIKKDVKDILKRSETIIERSADNGKL